MLARRLAQTTLLFERGQGQVRKMEGSLRSLGEYLDLSGAAAVGEGIESLLERLVHTASEITDAERATLFLVDEAAWELWSKVAEGAGIREIRIPIDSGVAGWVATERRLVNIKDAYADERFNREVDRQTGYRTRTILCAPIWSLQHEVLGVVQVVNKCRGVFSAQDEVLIRAFAHQAAVAVENFHLYQEIVGANRRMALMLDLATALGETLDLGVLIRTVVAKTTDALGCERSAFFVVDTKTATLWSMEATGSEVAEIRIRIGTGLAGECAREGCVINVADAYADDRFNPEVDRHTGFKTTSVLCVPVVNRDGHTTGVLQCINKRAGRFEESDERLLRAIGSTVSVALDNTQLFERVRSMHSYLESVQASIASAIVTLDGDYTVITANPAAQALVGAPCTGDVRALLGEGSEGLLELVRRVYATPEAVSAFDLRLVRLDAEVRTINASVLPLRDGEQGLVIVLDDLTRERQIKRAFGHYLAPAVIDRLLEDPARLALGGEKREITALFTDIEGFTALCEHLDPADLVQRLNEYFDRACDVVLRHGGTIDKIVGDSLHVLFNAPQDVAGHAERAVRCALELDRCCQGYAEETARTGRPLGRTRIGLATGLAAVGNFGGASRFDFTAHGDTVNTAARLESANRHLGTRICVAATTRYACPGLCFRAVGRLLVVGKSEPLEVFEPLVEADWAGPRVQAYLEAYRGLAGDAAAGRFAELAGRYPDDGLIRFHAERTAGGERGEVIVLDAK